MARALSFLIRYFSNYYTLHRSDLAARAAPLDPRLHNSTTQFSPPGNQDNDEDIVLIAAVAGGVGFLVILIIIILVFCVCRKSKSSFTINSKSPYLISSPNSISKKYVHGLN